MLKIETRTESGGRAEDRVAIRQTASGAVIVVADGAGGMGGGAAAAERACELALRASDAKDVQWCDVLLEIDRELAGSREGGQTTAVVVEVRGFEVMGASVGDSGAWLVSARGIVDLTAGQTRKPLLGDGLARPIPFGPLSMQGARLLIATDGLLKYASREAISAAAFKGSLRDSVTALIDAVRMRDGGLQDDVAVALAELADDAPSVIVPPATETLTRASTEASPWPGDFLADPSLRAEAALRARLLDGLRFIFDRIPIADMEIADAIEASLVARDDVAAAYDLLADFMESDQFTARLTLYLPVELLPDFTRPGGDPALDRAAARFARIYLARWREALRFHDLRANFVDGDIPEPELRDAPPLRVVKAAHLIPILLKKGLLSFPDVLRLIEAPADDGLRASLGDTMALLAEMNLPDSENARKLAAELARPPSSPSRRIARETDEIPEARAEWERKRRDQTARDLRAKAVAKLILHASIQSGPPAFQFNAAFIAESDPSSIAAIIRGLGIAVETAARSDPRPNLEAARTLFLAHEAALPRAEYAPPEVRDALAELSSRLAALGVIAPADDTPWRVPTPTLEGNLDANPELVALAAREFEPVMAALRDGAELSCYILPALIFFGSRLKGYGTYDSDLDVAVLVRPGTAIEHRPRIQSLIRGASREGRVGGKVVEFWLEDDAGDWKARDFPNPDTTLADASWAHILFGGAWYGDEAAIQEAHRRLLPPYLRADGRATADGRSMREVWLEEMERDALQYRLMHRGYARFFPPQGGLPATASEVSDPVDSKSAFWDSGYRRLATKLFLRRVFLPRLTHPARDHLKS